jgi:hypothetical protein
MPLDSQAATKPGLEAGLALEMETLRATEKETAALLQGCNEV